VRRAHVHELAYHTRFLILPGSGCRTSPPTCSAGGPPDCRRLQALYGHPVHYLETFVDPERFRGTCYRAANWQALGLTTGRGHNARSHRPTRSRKLVLGYPLHPDFRPRLGVSA